MYSKTNTNKTKINEFGRFALINQATSVCKQEMNTPLEETADDGQHGRGGPTVDVDVVGSSSTSTSTNNAFVGARIVETIARHNNKHILKQEQQQQQQHASGITTTTSPSERLRRSGIRVGDPISIRKYPINTIKLFFINGYSALLVFVLHLITLESLFSILLSVIMTICKFSNLFLVIFLPSSFSFLLFFAISPFGGFSLPQNIHDCTLF